MRIRVASVVAAGLVLVGGGCSFAADDSSESTPSAVPMEAAVGDYAVREDLADSGSGPRAIEEIQCAESHVAFRSKHISYCELRWKEFGIRLCAVVLDGRLLTDC